MSFINNIILIGLSYSGKTTLGKLLSERLSYDFIDTDKYIELECGVTINELFERYGEKYFREKEKELIGKLIINRISNTIIATGGGMPVYFDNITALKKLGTTIYLDIPLKDLMKRIEFDIERPLLQNDFYSSLIDMYATRINIYKKSHILVNLQNLNIEESVNAVIKSLGYIKEINNNVCK